MERKKEKTAYIFGITARVNGLKKAPALDENIRPVIKGLKPGEAFPFLLKWGEGWDQANAILTEDPN